MPNQITPPYIRLALALLLTSSLVGCGQGGSGSAAKGGFMGGPIEVGYQIVRAQDVALETELTGRVNAYETSEVRPQVDGVIRDRLYTEGARVQAGQALYQIDAAPYQAAYDSARAALGAAEATAQRAHQRADRFRRIVESGAVSRDANEDVQTADNQAQAAVDVARAQLETAKINLDYTKVRAPISGRIGRSLVTPGALVTARQTNPIATIQNFQQVYVDLTQSSAQLLALRQAQSSGQLTRDKTTLPVTLLLAKSLPAWVSVTA
jgi:membrane fusion protein (multidrug efflux system)